MGNSYELMDLDASNLVGSYRSFDEAYAIVRLTLATYGAKFVEDLGLFRVDGEIQVLIAEGGELVRLAAERKVA